MYMYINYKYKYDFRYRSIDIKKCINYIYIYYTYLCKQPTLRYLGVSEYGIYCTHT